MSFRMGRYGEGKGKEGEDERQVEKSEPIENHDSRETQCP